jgi:hypothetical protein
VDFVYFLIFLLLFCDCKMPPKTARVPKGQTPRTISTRNTPVSAPAAPPRPPRRRRGPGRASHKHWYIINTRLGLTVPLTKKQNKKSAMKMPGKKIVMPLEGGKGSVNRKTAGYIQEHNRLRKEKWRVKRHLGLLPPL